MLYTDDGGGWNVFGFVTNIKDKPDGNSHVLQTATSICLSQSDTTSSQHGDSKESGSL
jgi:hypothetical protein